MPMTFRVVVFALAPLLASCVNPLYSAADRAETAEYLRKVRDPATYHAMDCETLLATQRGYDQYPSETTDPIVQVIHQVVAQRGCSAAGASTQGTARVVPDASHTGAGLPVADTATATNTKPSTTSAELTARQTAAAYRGRSCDYLHAALIEADRFLSQSAPELVNLGLKMKSSVTQVLQEQSCPPASWVGGRMGASIATVDPVKAPRLNIPATGVWVEGTVPGSSAQRAGLVRGDVIVAINDNPVADVPELLAIVLKAPIRSVAKVKIWRQQAFADVQVEIAAPTATTGTAPAAIRDPAQAVDSAPMQAAPSATDDLFCAAVFESRQDSGTGDYPPRGIITNAWRASGQTSNPAQGAMAQFESYVRSQGHEFVLEPLFCQPAFQQCQAIGTEFFLLTMRSHSLSVSCLPGQGIESFRKENLKRLPYLKVSDWRPANSLGT